jgi:hypothetical protein
VELVIGSALMGMILYSVWSIVQAGTRYLLVSNETLDLQTNSLTSITRLSQELGESDPNCFLWEPATNSIEFASPRDASGKLGYDAYGRMLWMSWITYYTGNNGTVPVLYRKQKAIATPPPYPPAAPANNDLIGDATVAGQVISRHVTQFTATANNPVPLALTVSMNDLGRSFSLSLTTQIFLRN